MASGFFSLPFLFFFQMSWGYGINPEISCKVEYTGGKWLRLFREI